MGPLPEMGLWQDGGVPEFEQPCDPSYRNQRGSLNAGN